MLLFLLLCVTVIAALRQKRQQQFPVSAWIGDDVPMGLAHTIRSRFQVLQADNNVTVSVGQSVFVKSGQCNTAGVAALGSEAFQITASANAHGALLICVLGNPGLPNAVNASTTVNRGLLYGTYHLLTELGYAFLHPLGAHVPTGVLSAQSLASLHIVEPAPHYAVRGFVRAAVRRACADYSCVQHYHTQHPLELTELLQGFDSTNETWASMLPEFDQYCEWLIANKQNTLEFVLLAAKNWMGFAWSQQRQQRFVRLSQVANMWGVALGADMAIADQQQHAWHMVNDTTNAHAQIQDAIDWLAAAQFNFINSENGFSEFTHGSCQLMLDWMNFATTYAKTTYNIPMFIKAHCSTGQTCPDLHDPRTNQPVNFNFLPMLANKNLGILPHTVQMYRFDDPAPVYGNQNFTYMLDFLMYESDKRPTIYHPETAYWVNLDVNVPLFLVIKRRCCSGLSQVSQPTYADTRISDIRAIRAREKASGLKIDGQIDFTSGFEWGYWLNDVVCAYSSWRAPDASVSQPVAMQRALLPIAKSLFGAATHQQAFVQLILDTVDAQRQLLIFGNYSGAPVPPGGFYGVPGTDRRNGMGYITGWSTWAQLARLAKQLHLPVFSGALTNPDRVSLQLAHTPLHPAPSLDVVLPLLKQMETQFVALSARYEALRSASRAPLLYNDIADAMQMTALRATQVSELYLYVSTYVRAHLTNAGAAITAAQLVVERRQQAYRVPLRRVAGWRPNPTAYNFGYLWSVKSLDYWWRDYGIAHDKNLLEAASPCYRNIVNPIDVGLGEGLALNATKLAYELFSKFKWANFFADCLVAPPVEPHYNFTNS